MDLVKCKLFVITSETHNISKTAEITGYTQSNVSHALKSMENSFGLQLFTRDRYGVQLTKTGQQLLPHIRSVLKEEEKLYQVIDSIRGFDVGELSVGALNSISTCWLPEIIYGFNKTHPKIKIELREGGDRDIRKWLTDTEVDLAFYSLQPNDPFDFIHLCYDSMVAILPEDHSFPKDETVFPIENFNSEDLIISARGLDADTYRLLEEYNIEPPRAISSMNDYTIISMVKLNLGISIIPRLVLQVHGNTQGIRVLDLNINYKRNLGISMVNRRELTPIAEVFANYVQNYFRMNPEKFNIE